MSSDENLRTLPCVLIGGPLDLQRIDIPYSERYLRFAKGDEEAFYTVVAMQVNGRYYFFGIHEDNNSEENEPNDTAAFAA